MAYLSSFVSASDVIKKLCLRMEDVNLSRARLYASYMSAVYNDLRMDITKTSVLRKYAINTRTNSFPIPSDCLMLFGVGYEDSCGVIQPLWYNQNISKSLLFENSIPCKCDTCGNSSEITSLIKDISTIEEEVIVLGETYLKTTKIVTMNDGSIVEFITEPIVSTDDENEYVVTMETTEKELCKLELEPCGCVANTESNKEKIKELECTCCSLDSNCGTYSRLNPSSQGYAIDVTGTEILLPLNYNYDYIVLKYLTSISSEADFKIPAIAEEAFIRGIQYYSENDNPKAPPYSKGRGMRFDLYNLEKQKLKKRLRPTSYNIINGALGAMSNRE
jgi:hypothetical protein